MGEVGLVQPSKPEGSTSVSTRASSVAAALRIMNLEPSKGSVVQLVKQDHVLESKTNPGPPVYSFMKKKDAVFGESPSQFYDSGRININASCTRDSTSLMQLQPDKRHHLLSNSARLYFPNLTEKEEDV